MLFLQVLNHIFFAFTPLYAVLVVAALAIVLGGIILLIFRFFSVEVDEREEEVTAILPGVNCGGCGYSGCQAYAVALVSGSDTDYGKCSPGGQETVEKLSEYFGATPGIYVPKVARVHCQGSFDKVRIRYQYDGSTNCQTAAGLFGGPSSCAYGCLGLGDCARACEYGAIEINNGLARINPEKCIACGACVEACPKKIISIVPKYSDLYTVNCSNPNPGKDTRQVCDISCIGCTLCVRNCPEEAISMRESVAVIDQDICVQCGKCEEVCPTKAIVSGL